MPDSPLMKEDHISQIPALQLLQNLGYSYLSPEEALILRGGKESNVILNGILEDWLRKNNVIRFKGKEYPFTEGNIISAIQTLKDVIYDGLVRTNETIYDLLILGRSLQQSILGDIKSFSLKYIDWEHPEKNVFHVTEEFSVERSGSKENYRPDIVLFVNGIPFCVIECKRLNVGVGKDPIAQAVSQHIRNQKDDGIPHLFIYSQLLLAICKNEAKYATTGTPMEFWAVWREQNIDSDIYALINKPLSNDQKDKLFRDRFRYVRNYFDALEKSRREVTEQDRAVYSLCRPERVIEFARRYILYDTGEKKIARYQQYFTVKNIMERIITVDNEGKRLGGVVWHTQGSGKSLTMVMLAKAIAMNPSIENHKIILVTDRIDLDDQIYRTFHHCGEEDLVQARTGKHLIELLEGVRERIITTVIDKFDAAIGIKNFKNTGKNIFVLVDESHRSQYGELHTKMRKVLPNACFIGFTGTPLAKKDKSTMSTFGGLIQPTYTIDQAVMDKAVVPLRYEGRHVEQKVDSASVDSWFEKITAKLSQEQANDLKKKFATADQLNKAEQKVMRIAWDISEHFRDNWQGTPFKAQLVTQDKETALLYKKYLDEFGMVSSEVLISGPDTREGESDIYKENKEIINRFWKVMMDKYGTEKEYNRQIINAFKHGTAPEIIIVVDKLITGFDAPRNTVLYLTRKLEDHTLLQAIARVNRLYEGKEFGYILDYRGVIAELERALDFYAELSEYDQKDLEGTVTDISEKVQSLPQKHSVLWDVFKEVKNKRDEEEYEQLLADDALRNRFYERFSKFSRTLAIALSSVSFVEETPEKKINQYKTDLKFFKDLRLSVQKRYAEVIGFSDYEPKIKKLIDTHVGTGEVEQITALVNIFDKDNFSREVEKLSSDEAKADTIAHRTMRTIEECMQEDPIYYRKFSTLLQEAINAFHEQRIRAAEYLKRVTQIMESVQNRTGDEVPESLKNREVAKAYYGTVYEILGKLPHDDFNPKDVGAEAAIGIDNIITDMHIVNWTMNSDRQNMMRTAIEDYLFDLKEKHDIDLTFDHIDSIMEQCIEIAKVRVP
jgi:type I restriction enzyme R subunit